MKIKTIYDLELNEMMTVKMELGSKMEVTRVPGGWIYSLDYVGYRQAPIVFIPYNEEFKLLKGKKKKEQ